MSPDGFAPEVAERQADAEARRAAGQRRPRGCRGYERIGIYQCDYERTDMHTILPILPPPWIGGLRPCPRRPFATLSNYAQGFLPFLQRLTTTIFTTNVLIERFSWENVAPNL